MENANRWYFTKEDLENSPTRKCGIDASKELSYRQQGANFIQDMGQRLQVSQLCINTAIVYMHRFYVFHSFQRLHRNQLAVAALFLAAKVEEQPRKLEHVVRVAHRCLHGGENLDPKSDTYMSKCGDLVFHENMMLQTLGFDIAIDHPHTYVVKLLQLVKDSAAQKDVTKSCAKLTLIPVNGRSRTSGGQTSIEIGAETLSSATKDLAQTSYFMATNSLHLTTMCLQYRPTVVACVCIHLACKWSDWKIEPCTEGKEWYYYVDKSVTPELLEELTKDFLAVLEKSPNRLKRRIGPENKDQFKPGDEIITRMDSLTYDNCIDPPKGSLSPTVSISSSSAAAKEERREKEKPEASAIPESSQYSSPAKKTRTELKAAAALREKRKTELVIGAKSLVPAPMELPLPPIARSLAAPFSRIEKRLASSETLSNELVPQKTPEVKSSSKQHHSSSKIEPTSSGKVNHQISKTPVVPPTPSLPKSSSASSKNDISKLVISGNGKSNEPFVLLTRLDQTNMAKKVSESKTAQSGKVNAKPNSPLDVKIPESKPSTHPKPFVNACDTKSVAKPSELQPNVSSRPKHTKQKTPMQNSHIDAQLSQGNLQKPSPVWDLGKTNGSSVQSSVDGRIPPSPLTEVSKALEKNAEVHVKQEKKERHRHKHSLHSSKEKVSNHVTDFPAESNLPNSLKITIPKDKIVLSNIHVDQKSNASKDKDGPRLKIKIKPPLPPPPPPPPPPEAPVVKADSSDSGLKLVITKDKNAGSYSASRKAEKASRKRERSPSSKGRSSRSSAKQHKGDRSSQLDRIPANEADTGNCVAWNAPDKDGMYHQNNVAQQGFVLPPRFGQSHYYQQNYYNYSMPAANMQYGQVPPPLPPVPPSSNSAPPLPRGPPPPLPPQPPLPSE